MSLESDGVWSPDKHICLVFWEVGNGNWQQQSIRKNFHLHLCNFCLFLAKLLLVNLHAHFICFRSLIPNVSFATLYQVEML